MFTVIVRENGKLLGRLTPEGSTTNRNIFAAMLTKEQADTIAADINSGNGNLVSGLTATVRKF